MKRVSYYVKCFRKVVGDTKSFNETKYMYLLIKDDEIQKNTTQSGIKSAVVTKKDLIVNQYVMKNIQKKKKKNYKSKISSNIPDDRIP